ncbi:MAG: hypothetical protein PHY14_00525 [Candidatus Gracilibacteria bacterium]|nr:hypothetical protein [Candidatus Gracilibacteria bacterium]
MKKYKWIVIVLAIILVGLGVYFSQKEDPYVTIGDIKTSSDGKHTSIIGTRNGKQFVVTGKKESKKYDEITELHYMNNKLIFRSNNNQPKERGVLYRREEYVTIDGIEYGPYYSIKEFDISEDGNYSYIAIASSGGTNEKDTLIVNGKEIASYDKIQYHYICNGNDVFKASNNNEEFMVKNNIEGPHYKKIEGFDHNNGCLPNGDIIYIGEKETPKWTTGTGTDSEYTEYKTTFDFLKNDTVLASGYRSMMHYGLDGKWMGNWFITKDNHFVVPLEIEDGMPYENSKWKIMIDGVISPKVYNAVFDVHYTDDDTLKYAIIENNMKDWVTIPLKN